MATCKMKDRLPVCLVFLVHRISPSAHILNPIESYDPRKNLSAHLGIIPRHCVTFRSSGCSRHDQNH